MTRWDPWQEKATQVVRVLVHPLAHESTEVMSLPKDEGGRLTRFV
jgi:hypothetical protein